MEILAENIEKNFNDVPTFLKFMRASMRQTMIRRLPKHSTNKPAWSKAEDFIQDLLQKNTALTLENTQMVIDRAQTYMSREEKLLHTSTTLVSSTSADSEIEILKTELASLKAGTVSAAGRGTGRGKQGGARGGRDHTAVGRGRSTETWSPLSASKLATSLRQKPKRWSRKRSLSSPNARHRARLMMLR
jgi:hypothetical protein